MRDVRQPVQNVPWRVFRLQLQRLGACAFVRYPMKKEFGILEEPWNAYETSSR